MNRRIPHDFGSENLRPPSRWEILREARIVLEFLNAKIRLPRLIRSVARGRGEPVLVVPGVGADDSWTARLRGFLTSVGYQAVGWGLGRNDGNVPKLLPKVVERTERLAEGSRAPVRLVGWSLGGYLSREAARERPDLVERVITLGSPIVGGPSYTAAASIYRRRGYNLEEIEAAVAAREQQPITVPVSAVYSRTDGVVAWRACIDTFQNPLVEHHEVRSTHLGLVTSPTVLRLVATLLASPIGST